MSEQEEVIEKKDEVYMATKSRVLEAARTCTTTKRALKILFPDAFKGNFFRSGDLFIATDKQALRTKLIVGKYFKNSTESTCQLNGHSLNQYVLLIHNNGRFQYRLIHLATGYAYNDKTYTRTDEGIEIPEEDLDGLHLISKGESLLKPVISGGTP